MPDPLEDIALMDTDAKVAVLVALLRQVRADLRHLGAKVDKVAEELAEGRDVIETVRRLRREIVIWVLGSGVGGAVLASGAAYTLAG